MAGVHNEYCSSIGARQPSPWQSFMTTRWELFCFWSLNRSWRMLISPKMMLHCAAERPFTLHFCCYRLHNINIPFPSLSVVSARVYALFICCILKKFLCFFSCRKVHFGSIHIQQQCPPNLAYWVANQKTHREENTSHMCPWGIKYTWRYVESCASVRRPCRKKTNEISSLANWML